MYMCPHIYMYIYLENAYLMHIFKKIVIIKYQQKINISFNKSTLDEYYIFRLKKNKLYFMYYYYSYILLRFFKYLFK